MSLSDEKVSVIACAGVWTLFMARPPGPVRYLLELRAGAQGPYR
jgi:hypothetical protein